MAKKTIKSRKSYLGKYYLSAADKKAAEEKAERVNKKVDNDLVLLGEPKQVDGSTVNKFIMSRPWGKARSVRISPKMPRLC